tara:strand:- start:606 stop:776 length:171 start_codon:yes stop_codon:yes gene_type:complete
MQKVTTLTGVVFVLAVSFALSACQHYDGDWQFYNEGQYEERIWFDGWDKTFFQPKT